MGKIIYGSELSLELKESLKNEIINYCQNKRRPCLAVILVGDDPASVSYVKGKDKALKTVGMESVMINLASDTSQIELIKTIEELNENDSVDGILVQLPLPRHLNEGQVLDVIDPNKDVDGLHRENVAKLYLNEDGFVPCTPLGIMELLKKMEIDLEGKHAVVVGRSQLVGQPIAKLLLNANASVTICHSRTKDLKKICKDADVLVVAAGKAKLIDESYVNENCYVIDVGVNRIGNKLYGDTDFENIKDKCKAITPVPKGVGPMTITMLLYNTFKAYKKEN